VANTLDRAEDPVANLAVVVGSIVPKPLAGVVTVGLGGEDAACVGRAAAAAEALVAGFADACPAVFAGVLLWPRLGTTGVS
jgi:hypothetical protein